MKSLVASLMLSFAAAVAPAQELTVSAASSLQNAFRDLGPLFEAAHPGAKVRFNFGPSDGLLAQIARGAPVDVFASADPDAMDRAQQQNLIDAARRINAVSNTLVVIVPASASRVPQALPDLAQAGFARVAIGLPDSVPAGRYAKATLEAASLWAVIQPKMIGAQNVRQALDYVARGEVDAGFVYATDAAVMPDKVKVAFTVPTPRPIVYPIAPVSQGPNVALGRRFVDFVGTPAAQAVLARHGFGRP